VSNEAQLDTVLSLLRGSDAIAAPSVEPVQSVIRSGDQFLLGGQAPGVLGGHAPTPPAAPCGLQIEHLGGLVVEVGYEVEDKLAAQFHRWLQDNEDELSRTTPQGVRYRGTYAVVAQSNLGNGSYRTVWSFDAIATAGAIDAAVAAGGRFADLLKELYSFRDRRIGASRSHQWYQPAAGTRRLG
jgi:hypothetical protein